MKTLRWLGIVLLLLVVLSATVVWSWYQLPGWIKPRVQAIVAEKLGRTLDWEKLEMSFNERRIVITGVSLKKDTAPMVFVERIEAVFSLRSWTEKTVVLESLKVTKPRFNIARVDSQQYDFSDIVERFTKLPKSEPSRYAVSNIEIIDAQIDFDDRPQKQLHVVQKINATIPFVNTLIEPEKATIAPALSALIDGSPFTLKGDLLPFGEQLQGVLNIKLDAIELAKWQPYFPVELQLRFTRGMLNIASQLRFIPKGQNSIELDGLAVLDKVDVSVKKGPILAVGLDAKIPVKKLALSGNDLHFGPIEIRAQELVLQRDAAGRINWTRLWQPSVASSPATSAKDDAEQSKSLKIDQVAINAQRFLWADLQESALPQLAMSDFVLKAGPYQSLIKEKLEFELSFAAPIKQGLVASWKGHYDQSNDQVLIVGNVERLPLEMASSFVKTLGDVENGPTSLMGVADFVGEFSFVASSPATTLRINSKELVVKGPSLVQNSSSNPGKAPSKVQRMANPKVIVGSQSLQVKELALDLSKNQIAVKAVEATGLQASLFRNKEGIQLLGLAASTPAVVGTTNPVAVTKPLAWSIGALRCKSCVVNFRDMQVKPEVNFAGTKIDVELGALDHQFIRPVKFTLSASAQSERPWAFNSVGQWTPKPLGINAKIELANFDMARLEPYYTEQIKLRVTRGTLSTNGQFDLRGDSAGALQGIAFTGDVNVNDFQTLEKGSGNELLRWIKLRVPQLKLQSGSGPMVVETGVVEAEQLYARVLLNEKGELNLRDGFLQKATVSVTEKPVTSALPEASSKVRLGGFKMIDGNINFSDQFVKPNYTANLTQLNGEMSMLASDAAQPATLKLQGRVDSDAPLTIEGTLNPLAPTALLDLRAEAKSVDLTSLSPYSARWAGYAIDKGKLTAKLHYQIAEGRLNARNEILLNQLVLGEKIDSPDATRLPVKLAIALLKNNKGEIELDIPITGSLSDPEFAVGPLIWRALFSLIGKVVLSPFNALASLGGSSSEELSFIDFASGSTDMNDEGRAKVSSLSKALKDRPSLTLDIGGKADEQADRAGLQNVTLDLMLKGVKIQRFLEANPKADVPDLEKLNIGLEERPILVAQLYKDYNLPNKPKNILGLEKSVDADEQQRLIRESISIPSDLVKQLAARRGAITRELLMKEIPGERLFVIAPKVVADASSAAQNRRVEFALR